MNRPRLSGRGLGLAHGLAALALLAAGCGGSKTPTVANLATTTSSGSATSTTQAAGAATSMRASTAALAACFTSHGFPASPGSDGNAGEITFFGVTIGGNVNPQSAAFRAAAQACRKFVPGGGPPPMSPAQQAEHAKALAQFAACMRKSGVSNFPDPDGQGRFPFGILNQFDLNVPLFRTAYKACQPLLPTFGPQIRFQ